MPWSSGLLALDSSVLLRYLTQDDPAQSKIATELLETHLTSEVRGYVTTVALLETLWVLRKGYGYTPALLAKVAELLVEARQLEIAGEIAVRRALASGTSDLADRIIHELGRSAGCSETVTFDRRFARLQGVRLLDG